MRPDNGPKMVISTTRPAPVAMVLPSRAMATLPPANRSPMMPEPITMASSNAVPRPSATSRRARSKGCRGGSRLESGTSTPLNQDRSKKIAARPQWRKARPCAGQSETLDG